MTRLCDSAHDDPVPVAAFIGTLHTQSLRGADLVFPAVVYCQECADYMGEDYRDRHSLTTDASDDSGAVQ